MEVACCTPLWVESLPNHVSFLRVHGPALRPSLDRVTLSLPCVINAVFCECLLFISVSWVGRRVHSLGSAVESAVPREGFGLRAGEAAVLAHVQLFTALAVSVAGRLPVHLGEVCFK